jgi:hypothetical protein
MITFYFYHFVRSKGQVKISAPCRHAESLYRGTRDEITVCASKQGLKFSMICSQLPNIQELM